METFSTSRSRQKRRLTSNPVGADKYRSGLFSLASYSLRPIRYPLLNNLPLPRLPVFQFFVVDEGGSAHGVGAESF